MLLFNIALLKGGGWVGRVAFSLALQRITSSSSLVGHVMSILEVKHAEKY